MFKNICVVRIILKSHNLSINEVASEHVLASKLLEVEALCNALIPNGKRA